MRMKDIYLNQVRSAFFGLAIGDALGVPVEFKSREYLREHPIIDMIGYGTFYQPAGTWSDDSSLAFCLAEALIDGFDANRIAQYFVDWYRDNFWTARGVIFDIGYGTRLSLTRYGDGEQAELAGSFDENSNGNGSLMRILPLLFHSHNLSINERFQLTKKVSSITHGHIRSVIACFYYLEFARKIMYGKDKFEIYSELQSEVTDFLKELSIPNEEISHFDRLLKGNIAELPEDEIKSSGYVLHTLEASIWCFLTTDDFKEAVLKAVNLGEDTDTTGSVTGGIAGMYYRYENIPQRWITKLARYEDIDDLASRLNNSIVTF